MAGGTATAGGSAGGAVTAGGSGGQGVYDYDLATFDDPVDAGRVMAISGPGNNLFAVAQFGKVFHSTDGLAFNRVMTVPRNLLAVYVAPDDGSVFIASDSQLGVCRTAPCTSAASFVWSTPPGVAATSSFYGLCGDSASNVYAVGLTDDFNNPGIVVKYSGSGWSAQAMLGINNVRSCWLESSNVLWAAGTERVTKWNGTFGVAEGADLSALDIPGSAQQWFAVTGVGGELHVVGFEESIMSRRNGTWSLTLNRSTETFALWFRAVAGLHANELFAAGNNPTSPGQKLWRWNGTQWSSDASLPAMTEVRSAHAVPSRNRLYFGGQLNPMERAAIVRMTRR